MIIEKQIMWAVYDMREESLTWTLKDYANCSRQEASDFYETTWKELYKSGYRCRKVEVTIKTI